MLKNDIGIDAGVIWHLLSENGRLSVREIGEHTSYREGLIFMSLGWLARENKIRILDIDGRLFAELDNVHNETYY